MNRRSNFRGNQNRNNYQQQYDQHFVPSNGNSANNQQSTPVQQQNQSTPQKQQQQPQQQQQQPPQQQQQQQPQPVKPEPAANMEEPMPVDSNDESGEGGISAKMRKIFANRKNLTTAERKKLDKERKARQLRRLRKLLTPKNAVVALHEMQGPGMGEFIINTNGHETTAEIVLNNVRYEATAPNKHLAKARASEKALRDLVISQMAKSRQKQENSNNGNTNQDAVDDDTEMTDVSDNDDVPMLHLASYALYKLFNEWQNEGFEIPAIKPQKTSTKVNEAGTHPLAPKVAKTKADLPADAATRHPTALLAFMRPQVPYEDLGTNNNNDPLKREFSVGVTVDGQRYIGKARSKKLARKEAAAAACQSLFDVVFVETSAA
ncbi:myb-like protein AA [Wyeomyia smithii]|uniref:myb-like protein AA n=1 Tax=Wyeomyia smithii TaxID=174621 RepID=UPI0024681CA4|nr:myb-like protein AA [Wyeomyia smithii]